jgi:hypothetical protein
MCETSVYHPVELHHGETDLPYTAHQRLDQTAHEVLQRVCQDLPNRILDNIYVCKNQTDSHQMEIERVSMCGHSIREEEVSSLPFLVLS